jgi:hypothetical protein
MILFASGWKDILMRGMTSRVILLFFVSWFIGMRLFLAVPGGSFSLWVAFLLVYAVVVLWKLDGMIHKLYAISVGVLIGSLSFFMQEMVYMIPSMIFGSLELTMALMIGLLVVATIKLPSVQVAVLSMGLVLGDLYFLYIHRKHAGMDFGSLKLLDRWWLNVFVTRGLSIVMVYTLLAGKYGIISITNTVKSSLKKKLGNGE